MKFGLELKTEIRLSQVEKLLQKYSQYTNLELSQSLEAAQLLDFAVSGYYLKLIDRLIESGDSDSALRILSSIMPNYNETLLISEVEDGIGEEDTAEKNPFLSRLFPNRILMIVNNRCPVYCRYCFRRRRLGKRNKPITFSQIKRSLSFLRNEIETSKRDGMIVIDEVILSGGEPLAISSKRLEMILNEISAIKEIKTVRIDTKLLAVNPYAISNEIMDILGKCKTLYLVNHFIHPAEITSAVINKADALLKNRIITGAHIPIIKGVNDEYSIIKNLVNNLYFNKIRPYYLIQFIPTKWTEHFRVPLEKSIEIRERLIAECSGFSIPTLVVYLPDGKGKAVINSKRDIRKTVGGYILTNTLNEEVFYEEKI